MKTSARLLILVSVLLVPLCFPSVIFCSWSSVHGVEAVDFSAAKADLISPFWFWNGDMQSEEMERQRLAIKEAGINSVVF